MNRLFQIAAIVAVAGALPASTRGLAQVQKAAVPAPPAAPGQVVMEAKVAAQGKVKAQAVPVRPAVPAVPNLDPWLQQFNQLYRQVLQSEYHFVRTVCDLNPGQRKAIALDAERAFKTAAKQYAEQQVAMRQVRIINGQRVNVNPQALILDGLATAVKGNLTPEQFARYQDEVAKRNANRKQVTIHSVIAKMDRSLVLSAAQREKLAESLAAHWDESWSQSMQMFFQGDQYYPSIPDPYVVPFLNASQKKVWAGTQRVQGIFFGGVNFMGIANDNALDDGDLEAARKALAEQDAKNGK